MTKKRAHYSTEFKLEAIKLVESSNLTISEVARVLNDHHTSLRAWIKEYSTGGSDAFPGHGRQSDAEAENNSLRMENAKLKKERDFLKKAATFFAKESE
ncbi:MAG: transposase [Desulfobacterales bacterium]|nr:transposase [Desulfobacterales bacterium]